MATIYKVRYKNHCTPQEQIIANGRYYLDSDCGRKLGGFVDSTNDANGTLTTGVSISTSAVSIASTKDFLYVKNTGSETVYISLTSDSSAEYVMSLQAGEAFASDISSSANVRVKTASGTSTVEYFTTT